MKLRIVPAAAVTLLLCAALRAPLAGAEEEESEIRDLVGFDAIEVGGFVDLVVAQGGEFRVEVSGTRESLDNLVTETRGDTLKINQHPKRKRWFGFERYDPVSVSITLPELRTLHASGATDVRSRNSIAGDRLSISSSGGSDVTIDVEVADLQVSTSGGSDMTIAGTATVLHARSSGGSDLNATELQAVEADVHSSGGSDIELAVTQRLTARASGGSDIHYRGNPQFVDADSSGGADVQRR